MLSTLALEVFSSCEVSTDMTNSQMPVLEKYVNHLYDVTVADDATPITKVLSYCVGSVERYEDL